MSAKPQIADAPAGRRLDLGSIGAPARAQVNLLPPEVRSRRALGRVKLRLALALGLVFLLAGLGYAYAALAEHNAAQDLAAKEAEVQSLIAEQAQYAEVPMLKNDIANVQAARAYGMSTEVLWRDVLGAIQAVAPAGVSLKTLVIDLPSPGVAAAPAANPLALDSIGTISFTGRSATVPDVAAWIEALDSIPGFSDAAFSAAVLSADEGVSGFDVTSTVQVDQTVFAHRFDQTEDAG